MSPARLLVFFVAVGLLTRCTSSRRGGGSTEEGYTLLQEVNDLLRASAGATGRPPSKVADLNPHQTMFSRAHAAVKAGDVVVVWAAPLKGEGEGGKDEVVVEYEKNVPTGGGFVLLSAGTIKKMSASEFNSAPKAT
jgi:hypothetical protein